MDDPLTLSSSMPLASNMSGVRSFYKLLLQASSLPCSSGAAAILSLVPSENNQLPLAFDILLPVLQDRTIKPPQRILAAYVLHVLYASHDHLNPFHDHLLRVFESERTAVSAHSRTLQFASSPNALRLPQSVARLQADNEQLVWVLWKILRGEGEDLAPYSPNILSRTTLPEHLRVPHIGIHNAQSSDPQLNSNSAYPSNSRNSPVANQMTTATHSPHSEQEMSSHSPAHTLTPHFPLESSRTQSASPYLPFESRNIRGLSDEQISPGGNSNEWRREASPDGLYQDQDQTQYELLYRLPTHSKRSQLNATSMHEYILPHPNATTKDHRREALLHALYPEGRSENIFQTRGRTEASPYIRSSDASEGIFNQEREMRRSGSDVLSGYESRHGLRGLLIQQPSPQYSPTSPSLPSHVQPQFLTAQNNEVKTLGHQADISTSSFPTTTSSFSAMQRSQPGPIARPRPAASLFHNSAPQQAASVTISLDDSLSSQHAAAGTYSQTAGTSLVDGSLQQTQRSVQTEFSQNMGAPSASLNPVRNPGVIGSGRPSSKSISPVGSDAGERGRRLNVGVIGNGRPPHPSPGARSDVGNKGAVGMLPHSVDRTVQVREGGGKKYFGAIERPKSNTREVGEWLVEGRVDGTELARMEKVNNMTTAHSPAPRTAFKNSNGDPEEPMVPTRSQEAVQSHSPLESSIFQTEDNSLPASTKENLFPDTRNFPLSSSLSPLPPPASTSSSQTEGGHLTQKLEDIQTPSIHTASATLDSRPEIDEKARDELSRAILLLLSARERVLTLSEQRALIPHLPMLTRPLSLLRPGDLDQLVAKNPDVAAKLLVLLLDRDDEDGVRVERLLRNSSKNDLIRMETAQGSLDATSHAPIDAVQMVVQFVTGTNNFSSDSTEQEKVSPFGGREAKEGYLEALRRLPPTMQSFNLIARLLRPTTSGAVAPESFDSQDTPETRVARLVRTDVLGGLITGCVHWIEKAEEGERDGEVLDDRVAVYVSNLSRFYTSLLKHGFVSAESEVDTTEIMSFALQFSRFEEARGLYSFLAAARA